MPPSAYTFQRPVPARPFLVVMTMTPFAASVPYSVAADGPFTISMFSMSSGLMSPKRLKFAPPLPNAVDPLLALMRLPSITKIGSFDKLMLLTPRAARVAPQAHGARRRNAPLRALCEVPAPHGPLVAAPVQRRGTPRRGYG